MEVSRPTAEGNTQPTHWSLHQAQQNPQPMANTHPRAPTLCQHSPEAMGRKALAPKLRLCFLIFWLSTCHHHRRTSSVLLNPTNRFNIIIPVGFFLPWGFFSQKKHLFKNICNTRESDRLPINFYHNGSFWRQVFLPLQKHHLLLKAISVGFCDQIPVVCMFYVGQYNHWNKSQL